MAIARSTAAPSAGAEVYRADALHKLTEADLASFRGLGVRAVFDLRGDAERDEFPGPFESIHLPIVGRPESAEPLPPDPELTSDGGERMLRDMYVGALNHSAAQFNVLLTALADPSRRPAVFHCHGGKDRTGVSAAVLLLALGVDRETVLDDYEATRRYRLIEHQQDSLLKMLEAGVPPEAAAGVLGDATMGDGGGGRRHRRRARRHRAVPDRRGRAGAGHARPASWPAPRGGPGAGYFFVNDFLTGFFAGFGGSDRA